MKIVVTGASKGIGRGIATYLASKGHVLGLLARSRELLDELKAEIERGKNRAAAADCDVRDFESTRKAMDSIADALGGIDVLINNAGLVVRKGVFALDLDEWRAMLDTNVSGVFYATRAVLPYMRDQRSGHIINVSSISGKLPLAGGSAYAATKYAVTGFSQSLFQEVREYNIKVSVIFPGSVDSASHRHDPGADPGWKVAPEEVGRVCDDLLQFSPGTCVSEVEIRPLSRPPR